MSECRALTNLVGNGVATLAVAAWEKQLDRDQLNAELRVGPAPAEADERAFRPVEVPTPPPGPAPRRTRLKAPTPIKPKPKA